MSAATFNARTGIVVSCVQPTIACRQFDYVATFEGCEPGDAIGHGATEQQAVAELIEQEEVRS